MLFQRFCMYNIIIWSNIIQTLNLKCDNIHIYKKKRKFVLVNK